MNMSERDIENFLGFIKDEIRNTVSSNSLTGAPQKPVKIIGAVVVSVNGNDVTVRLAGDDADTTVLNFTNQTLVAKDRVEVVIKNGNYSNAFIGWKHP